MFLPMLSSWKTICLKSPGLVQFVWGKSQIGKVAAKITCEILVGYTPKNQRRRRNPLNTLFKKEKHLQNHHFFGGSNRQFSRGVGEAKSGRAGFLTSQCWPESVCWKVIRNKKLLYFEWSPPWHVGWGLSGYGCHLVLFHGPKERRRTE